jgi:CheY-like chemotaxis protein
MKQRALVVEDDAEIAESVGDTLESLGHDYEWVKSQEEARAKIRVGGFTYVLLDLQIPVCFGRGLACLEYGEHLAREIDQSPAMRGVPIIGMTAYGKEGLEIAAPLCEHGVVAFINKPFPRTGRTLAAVIKGVLDNHGPKGNVNTSPLKEAQPFQGGVMTFRPDRVELLGETIAESSERANYWVVLQRLKHRRPDGRFVPARGTELARLFKGGRANENTVSSCVGDLRDRITRAMDTHGLKCKKNDVIMSGGPGYRLKPWIEVRDAGRDIAGTCGDTDVSDVPARKADVPANPANVPLSDRQHWVLDQLRQGAKLERRDLEKQFDVGLKTAKRDLSDIVKRGLIEFVRTPRPGHYRLAKR